IRARWAMRIFAYKQRQPQKRILYNFPRPGEPGSTAIRRSHPMLHLQRAIGNRGVRRLMQSTRDDFRAGGVMRASSNPLPAISRQVKFGPLTVGSNEADVHRRQEIKRDAWKRLPGVAKRFVDLAFSAAQNGARTANKPTDPIARENFNR